MELLNTKSILDCETTWDEQSHALEILDAFEWIETLCKHFHFEVETEDGTKMHNLHFEDVLTELEQGDNKNGMNIFVNAENSKFKFVVYGTMLQTRVTTLNIIK